MPKISDRLLNVEDLTTGYGRKQVLNGISMHLCRGEIVAIIGHNGAGKSTLLKAIFGLLTIWKGEISIQGAQLGLITPRSMLHAGVSYAPQGNRVFSDLTVFENLLMGRAAFKEKASLDDKLDGVFHLFPTLKHRLNHRAETLSGGEKQMLALATVMVQSPQLLLLDEPSLGLSPPLVREAFERIREISNTTGSAVLIVEQKVREVLSLAQRVYVLRNGGVSYSGSTETLANDAKLREVYL